MTSPTSLTLAGVAIERFIIGTFASLGWAALSVGVVEVVTRGPA